MKELASARAFLEDTEIFPKIVEYCGLIPDKDTWMLWYDETGNKLRIAKNKAIHVYSARKPAQATTDIFIKSNINQILNYSKWQYFLFAKNNIELIWTLSKFDNKLRLSLKINNEWKKNIMPIMIGYEPLKQVISHNEITKNFRVEGCDIYPLRCIFDKGVNKQ